MRHTQKYQFVPHFEIIPNKAFIKICHPENWAGISKLLANGNQYWRTFTRIPLDLLESVTRIPSISCNQGRQHQDAGY